MMEVKLKLEKRIIIIIVMMMLRVGIYLFILKKFQFIAWFHIDAVSL
jgi:hypothetical protein